MSSMRRAAYILPLLLVSTAGSSAAQVASTAPAPIYSQATDVGYAVNDWRRLRQNGSSSFAHYARFLIYNPGWPGDDSMRRAAEKVMRPGEAPATVIAFFQAKKPKSGTGYARLADAYAASGRPTEALVAAREAWASDDLSAQDESALAARYWSSFTPLDHDRRADALLFAKKPEEARRVLPIRGVTRARVRRSELYLCW